MCRGRCGTSLWLHSKQPSRLAREVSDDDVGARAPYAEERVHHDALAIDPSAIGSRVNHSVLATDLVRGDGITRLDFDAANDVEERTGRLHHDHVRAFLD